MVVGKHFLNTTQKPWIIKEPTVLHWNLKCFISKRKTSKRKKKKDKSSKKIYGCQTRTWKDVNTISYQRMQIKTQWDTITCPTFQLLKLKSQTIPNFGKDVEQLELSYAAGRNVKWHSPLENNLTLSSKDKTYIYNKTQSFHSLGTYPREMKA